MAKDGTADTLDPLTRKLVVELCGPGQRPPYSHVTHDNIRKLAYAVSLRANSKDSGGTDEPGQAENIVQFFLTLRKIKRENGFFSDQVGFPEKDLVNLARLHQQLDEHGITIGGRVFSARSHVEQVNRRRDDYNRVRASEAQSGLDLWPQIQENRKRIQARLRMTDEDWASHSGQIKNSVDSLITLSQVVDLPEKALVDLMRATKIFRMRITPYLASLIVSKVNDPVMLQCVPSGEFLDNTGEARPPIAREYSPARLVDQIYPATVAIKCTNMCPMYCTFCNRLEYVGDKDLVYQVQAYSDAVAYIKSNENIRDVLLTGGDPFMLPDKLIAWILNQLDKIPHVKTKRIGTRAPVASPYRFSNPLLEILARSNDVKPLRIVVHVNSAQEITPLTRQVFKRLSRSAASILGQTVLLRGVNDTRAKMWSLCETLHESYVKPYYLMHCSDRYPRFAHLRVPVETGQRLVESMHGNLPGDAVPRFVALAVGKVPLENSQVVRTGKGQAVICKPWDGQEVVYRDADPDRYADPRFAFAKYGG
jgi:lysine 2,3-aminomutase